MQLPERTPTNKTKNMSAYICDRHHIIYLSKFAAENCKHLRYRVGINDSDPEKLTLHFANLLIRENFRSIYVRYPDTNPEKAEAWKGEETSPLPGDSLCAEPFTLSEIKKSYWLRYNPSQIVKAAQCYCRGCPPDFNLLDQNPYKLLNFNNL